MKYLLTLVGPAGPASAPVRRIACKMKILLTFQNSNRQEKLVLALSFIDYSNNDLLQVPKKKTNYTNQKCNGSKKQNVCYAGYHRILISEIKDFCLYDYKS